MRTKVTEHGVLNPEGLLASIDEVEIQKTHNMVIIMPVQADDLRAVCTGAHVRHAARFLLCA